MYAITFLDPASATLKKHTKPSFLLQPSWLMVGLQVTWC